MCAWIIEQLINKKIHFNSYQITKINIRETLPTETKIQIKIYIQTTNICSASANTGIEATVLPYQKKKGGIC